MNYQHGVGSPWGVGYLPCPLRKYEVQSSDLLSYRWLHELDVVVCACNLSAGDAGIGLKVPSQAGACNRTSLNLSLTKDKQKCKPAPSAETHTPVIPAFGKWRQEDQSSRSSLAT